MLLDAIKDVVKLEDRGEGRHIGLCPFHEDTEPLFAVSETKGFYHCFGCGAHGNHDDFEADLERAKKKIA